MSVASWCCTCFCVVLCVSFCTGYFVMVPLNLTYLHCLQHSFFEHLFNLYYVNVNDICNSYKPGPQTGSLLNNFATPDIICFWHFIQEIN